MPAIPEAARHHRSTRCGEQGALGQSTDGLSSAPMRGLPASASCAFALSDGWIFIFPGFHWLLPASALASSMTCVRYSKFNEIKTTHQKSDLSDCQIGGVYPRARHYLFLSLAIPPHIHLDIESCRHSPPPFEPERRAHEPLLLLLDLAQIVDALTDVLAGRLARLLRSRPVTAL